MELSSLLSRLGSVAAPQVAGEQSSNHVTSPNDSQTTAES
jgi:hypothetical protein